MCTLAFGQAASTCDDCKIPNGISEDIKRRDADENGVDSDIDGDKLQHINDSAADKKRTQQGFHKKSTGC